ncbi:SDR family oxidoreductase [Streptomyces pseudogriseolus]|uniref:SDR family oxidoreductase n=1 Tax=Streptomyces pseudogriseolus TaxID=36817 RepID=UPI003FA2BAE4
MLRQELNDVLPTGGPLWRPRLVRDPRAGTAHLYFTRNHAISDGHSTGAVVRALVDALFGPAGAPSPHDVRSVAPNGDELTYCPPGRPTAPLAARPEPVPSADHRPWRERGADFVPLALTRQESLALKAWCRSEGVTVNQFFAAALAESFAVATGRTEVALFTAVSLRKRYTESATLPDVGCFIKALDVPLRLDRTPLWEGMEATAREHMYEAVARRLPVGRVGEAADVAQAVLFLSANAYATGTTVYVDGGGTIA